MSHSELPQVRSCNVQDLVRQRKAEIAAESEGEIRKSDLVGHDLMTTMRECGRAQ